MRILFIFLTFSLMVNFVTAKVEIRQFKNSEHEIRYKKLVNELRCVVCQNQNLADSNASLAQDLRKQVFIMIDRGDDDKAILEYMVSRYGKFVLYSPPLDATTLFLWIGPFIILVLGLVILINFIRKRKQTVPTEMSHSEKEKIKQLFENKDS